MSISRSFRALGLYDVLANLIPGAVLLITINTIFQIERYVQFSTSAIAVSIFIVTAFVVGHLVQAIGSTIDGTPTLFADTIRAVRGGDEEETPINTTYIEKSIWPLIQRKFALPENYNDYGEMFRLLLSYIETTPATRALRFQSLHSFHRSMWTVSIITSIVAFAGILLKIVNLVAIRSWPVLGMTVIGSSASIFAFCRRKQKFNKKFIQYAIVDFYTDQIGEVNNKARHK